MDSRVVDSVLGEHSADFGDLEATADHQSCSTPKSPKNYESPTAMPRILEEYNRGGFEKSASLSLRADLCAWQSTQPLESTFPHNAHCVIASFAKQSAAIHTESTFENEDSRDTLSTAEESTMYRKKPTPNENSRDKAQDVSESRRQDF